MTDTDTPSDITPEKVWGLLDGATPTTFGKINTERKDRQRAIFNNTDGMSEITYEFIRARTDGIASDDMPTSSAAYQSLVYRVEDLAQEYLKLHEGSQRLQSIVQKQRSALTAIAGFPTVSNNMEAENMKIIAQNALEEPKP